MKLHYCNNYMEMSRLAAQAIRHDLRNNPAQLICTATGNSPTALYKELANGYTKKPEIFEDLNIVKLDEWGGIDPTEDHSCETYIRTNILGPLQITDDRFISFDSNPDAPIAECKKIQQKLDAQGPIDLCILGLGKNGHIGFNEPAKTLTAHCHVTPLSKHSLQHEMISGMKQKPSYGLTLGMADILKSKKIILVITGSDKAQIITQFLSQKISTSLPASFLWLHPNVECYLDTQSLNGHAKPPTS